MLDVSKPFVLYADCSVEYDGRAYSLLDRGNYLIILKSDKSIQIHTGRKITPINYQGANSTLEYADNKLRIINKKEQIVITIFGIINITYLENWSIKEINIFKTESDLVNKIIENIRVHIQDEVKEIIKEYKTALGPIDIAVIGNNLHLIEVKRNSVSASNVYQLKRYIDCLDRSDIVSYIAGPKIKGNALDLCSKNNIKYIEVGF